MKRMFGVVVVALTAWMAAGCSSVVGAECRAPYQRCGRYCVDLSSDRNNCGVCGNACVGVLACTAGQCGVAGDGGVGDGGRIDGGRIDAAVDGGRGDAGALDGGAIDARADDADVDAPAIDADLDAGTIDAGGADAGGADAGAPRCGLGELLCGTDCVDPDDPAHCGDCTTVCSASEVCAAGTCTASCAPLTDCGSFCADLTSDPDHCGTCTMNCGSGICVAGVCESAIAGHLVVIGHDFEQRRSAMSTMLANAVLLPSRTPVRVLVWQASSTPAAIAGTMAALTEGAGARTFVTTVTATPESVPVLLDGSDTFLILGQAMATNVELGDLGRTWSTALDQFLHRGGVVVVLEAPSLMNAGTFQILSAAGLFNASAISELVLPRLTTVAARAGDAVLLGVPLSYRGEQHTVFYSTFDPDAIVTSTSGPVVFDRTVTP